MDNDFSKKILVSVILFFLVALSFLMLRPILLSIIMGIILVVVFVPVYNWALKYLKYKSLTAFLICITLILLIILPIGFLAPIFVKQSFEVYLASQKIDFVTTLEKIFPSLFTSEVFSVQAGAALNTFVTNSANSLVNSFSRLILNFPIILLQLFVVFFTFFFVLRDGKELISYIKSIMPFTTAVEKRLFDSSKDITRSVVYGQIVLGAIQGLIVGFGFFIFGVSNPLLLTSLAVLAGIFPIIGTTIVWFPVIVYLFATNNVFSAIGVGIFGLIALGIDNIIRPILVSKRTRMHPLLILIGMVGGLLFFGILGFILGPLIIAYILIILEVYRGKEIEGFFIKPDS